MSILGSFFDFVKIGGLPFIFLLAFLEGNPVVGSFIPGQVIIIFVGFLISTSNLFDFKLALISVFLGAFLGDMLGYYMGRKFGFKGLKKFGVSEDSAIYKSSCSFFKKYGMWSIFLGREFNLTRAFVPFFAGSFGMKFWRFFVMAFISCAFWTVISLYLGYYFGFIIIERFEFIMWFVSIFALYLFIMVFVYRKIRNYFEYNEYFLRRYAIHNFVFLGFLISMFFLMIYLIKWDYFILFNDSFSFLFFSSFYGYSHFLLSKPFLILYFFIILSGFLLKKSFKMGVVYLWSVVILFFFTTIIAIFLKLWFDILPFFSIILFTFLVFYTWVLIKVYKVSKKIYYRVNSLLIILLFIVFMVKFSYTGNLFLSIFSFLIGVIICEFLWLFSYYQVLDKCLYNSKGNLL